MQHLQRGPVDGEQALEPADAEAGQPVLVRHPNNRHLPVSGRRQHLPQARAVLPQPGRAIPEHPRHRPGGRSAQLGFRASSDDSWPVVPETRTYKPSSRGLSVLSPPEAFIASMSSEEKRRSRPTHVTGIFPLSAHSRSVTG